MSGKNESSGADVGDGGPAFGSVISIDCVSLDMDGSAEYEPTVLPGQLSVRDYFAAKAMHAELMTCGVPGEACDALCAAAAEAGMDVADRMAFNAYEMADAMLKARSAT